uniref:Uncharacterized protein n=1 Tax=Rhizophora mucronata TaxID=61149 RepID=A0A2P2IQJ1_RHIMU
MGHANSLKEKSKQIKGAKNRRRPTKRLKKKKPYQIKA